MVSLPVPGFHSSISPKSTTATTFREEDGVPGNKRQRREQCYSTTRECSMAKIGPLSVKAPTMLLIRLTAASSWCIRHSADALRYNLRRSEECTFSVSLVLVCQDRKMNGPLRLSISRRPRSAHKALAALAVLLTATPAALVVSAGSAGANPVSAVRSVHAADDGVETVAVHSASMDRDISMRVLRAPTAGAPTLYLLNGAAGGEGGSSWFDQTDVRQFFADKNVNVVVPDGGAASYYTDWFRDDPALGRNKWNTFLAHELPPLIDDLLGADGVNAVAGISIDRKSVV